MASLLGLSVCFTFVGHILGAAMVESMVDHGRARDRAGP